MEDVFVAMIEAGREQSRMNLRRTQAGCARRSCCTSCATARSLTLALALPLVMLLLFGYALTLDVDQIPTMVYDQDRTPQSRELIEQFQRLALFPDSRLRQQLSERSSAPSTRAPSC